MGPFESWEAEGAEDDDTCGGAPGRERFWEETPGQQQQMSAPCSYLDVPTAGSAVCCSMSFIRRVRTLFK